MTTLEALRFLTDYWEFIGESGEVINQELTDETLIEDYAFDLCNDIINDYEEWEDEEDGSLALLKRAKDLIY